MRRFANRRTDTDVVPFEVIDFPGSNCLLVRDMIADLKPGWKPKVIMSQCINNDEQEWIINSDPNGLSFQIKMMKDGRWKDVHGNRYTLDERPERWHRFGLL